MTHVKQTNVVFYSWSLSYWIYHCCVNTGPWDAPQVIFYCVEWTWTLTTNVWRILPAVYVFCQQVGSVTCETKVYGQVCQGFTGQFPHQPLRLCHCSPLFLSGCYTQKVGVTLAQHWTASNSTKGTGTLGDFTPEWQTIARSSPRLHSGASTVELDRHQDISVKYK